MADFFSAAVVEVPFDLTSTADLAADDGRDAIGRFVKREPVGGPCFSVGNF